MLRRQRYNVLITKNVTRLGEWHVGEINTSERVRRGVRRQTTTKISSFSLFIDFCWFHQPKYIFGVCRFFVTWFKSFCIKSLYCLQSLGNSKQCVYFFISFDILILQYALYIVLLKKKLNQDFLHIIPKNISIDIICESSTISTKYEH